MTTTPSPEAAEIIRVGDLVELVGEVIRFGDRGETALIRFDGSPGYERWLTSKFIRSGRRISRPLQVGDPVKTSVGFGLIKCIEDDEAWVQLADTKRCGTFLLDTLELAPSQQ